MGAFSMLKFCLGVLICARFERSTDNETKKRTMHIAYTYNAHEPRRMRQDPCAEGDSFSEYSSRNADGIPPDGKAHTGGN